MPRKAQSSVEVMVGIVVLIFIGMVAQLFIFEKTATSWQIRSHSACLDISNSVANGLNLAAYSEGSSTRFTIPNDLSNTPYNLTVYGDYVTVDYYGDSCLRRYTALSAVYNNSNPPFVLAGGTYRVNNTNGVLGIDKIA